MVAPPFWGYRVSTTGSGAAKTAALFLCGGTGGLVVAVHFVEQLGEHFGALVSVQLTAQLFESQSDDVVVMGAGES